MANVTETILAAMARVGERVALHSAGQAPVPHDQLRRSVEALSDHLRSRGLQPGERVLLQVPAGFELTAATLAVLHAGAVPVLCEPGLGDAVYASRVRLASPGWLLVDPRLRLPGRSPTLRRLLRRLDLELPPSPDEVPRRLTLTGRSIEALGRSRRESSPVVRAGEEDALVVFTGGTTSLPKGVRLSHAALLAYLAHVGELVAGLEVEDLVADTLPQVLLALSLGRTAHLSRGRGRRRAARILQLIESGEVDSYFGAPFIWVEMMAIANASQPRRRLPASLRSVLLGSAPVTRPFLAGLRSFLPEGTRAISVYGLTEVGPVCSMSIEEKLDWSGLGDPVGTPLPGLELSVDAAPGEIGEVRVGSASLYSGYLGQPARAPGEPLRTGDLGQLLDRGGRPLLVLAGRQKDMIIRRAVNIYPGTLEPLLRELADDQGRLLAEAALVGVWDTSRQDEQVVLCAQPAPGRSLDPEAIRRAAARVTGPDGAPDRVLLLDELPVAGRQNKLDKRALAELARCPADGGSKASFEKLPGLRVPFGWRAFGRKLEVLLRHEHAPGAVLGQTGLRLALLGAGQLGWILDELLAGGWREARLEGPLFILGHQRSGTTLLQRLLTSDPSLASAMTLREMLLPSISLQGLFEGLAHLDEEAGGWLGRLARRGEEKLFGPLDDLHRIRFGAVEEDEFALFTIFASAMCANDAPSTTELPDLDELRHFQRWPARRRAEALGWYRACLLKNVWRRRAELRRGSWIVAKNPAFTHKVPELLRVFPEARFVYLVRDPLQAIPSRLSLIREIWRRRFPGFREMTPRQVETILADSLRTYLAAERDLPSLPDDRCLTIRYPELVTGLPRVSARIVEQLGFPDPDGLLLAAASRQAARDRDRRSRHRYTLAEFGVEEARIREELAGVFQRHGFAG